MLADLRWVVNVLNDLRIYVDVIAFRSPGALEGEDEQQVKHENLLMDGKQHVQHDLLNLNLELIDINQGPWSSTAIQKPFCSWWWDLNHVSQCLD